MEATFHNAGFGKRKDLKIQWGFAASLNTHQTAVFAEAGNILINTSEAKHLVAEQL